MFGIKMMEGLVRIADSGACYICCTASLLSGVHCMVDAWGSPTSASTTTKVSANIDCFSFVMTL